METNTSKVSLATPVAIIVAGTIVALGLYVGLAARNNTAQGGPVGAGTQSADLEAMRAVDAADHIRGNPNAPVVIVEYSDTECPFCKRFHATMQQIMNEYGGRGTVAWVYRHFPLDQLHTKARTEAVAFECAAQLGGNDTFWKFADRWYELTPSNDQTDIETILPQIAREVGLDAKAFAACRASGTHDARVEADVKNAVASGGSGTPWSIVIGKGGTRYPLSGAQPYEAVKQIIELASQGK